VVLTGEVQSETVRRWRLSLALVVVVCAVGCAISWVVSLAYGESLVVPVLLALGTGCFVMARRSIPATLTAGDRAALGASAGWVVVGILVFLVGPVALSSLS
jgi:hypothetical protein